MVSAARILCCSIYVLSVKLAIAVLLELPNAASTSVHRKASFARRGGKSTLEETIISTRNKFWDDYERCKIEAAAVMWCLSTTVQPSPR